jgi:hypothetical protein
VVQPPLKGLETKNKKKGLGFGGGRITPKGLKPPPYRSYGVVETTSRPLGVVWPPSKPLTFLFCFVFRPFESGRTTPKADWGGSSTPDRPRGWLPLANNGVAGHSIGQRRPPLKLFLILIFFVFNYYYFYNF